MHTRAALTETFRSPTGKKNKLRVYYLSWLRNRILHNDPEVEKKQGWITVGDLEGCIHYKVGEWTLRKKMSGGMRFYSLVLDLTWQFLLIVWVDYNHK